jgi:membrane protein implicated in regulation of membrane protease activity
MKLALLGAGVLAWLGVAIIAVLVVNAWSDGNLVLAFFPIAAAVVVAWLIGEWVTERVFLSENSEEVRHGSA